MRSDFPLKGEEAYDAISGINYQPRVADEHALAQDEARRIIARNHGFDFRDEDAFEGWDTVKQAQMMGVIFDTMDEFLGTVGLVTLGSGRLASSTSCWSPSPNARVKIGLRKALAPPIAALCCNFLWRDFAHTGQWTRGHGTGWRLYGAARSYNFQGGLIRRGSFFDLRSWPSPV